MPPSDSSLAAGRIAYQPAREGTAEMNIHAYPYVVLGFLEQLPFYPGVTPKSFAGGCQIMLSSNPSQLYVQSGRTIWCLMCKADTCWVLKIVLKSVSWHEPRAALGSCPFCLGDSWIKGHIGWVGRQDIF